MRLSVRLNVKISSQSKLTRYNAPYRIHPAHNSSKLVCQFKSRQNMKGGSNPKIKTEMCMIFCLSKKIIWKVTRIKLTNFKRIKPRMISEKTWRSFCITFLILIRNKMNKQERGHSLLIVVVKTVPI